jgi:hypothetical protein
MPQDRHGRARRADADRLRRPADGFRTRDRRRFMRLVLDVLPTLPEPLRKAVREARVRIEEVPPENVVRLARWEGHGGGSLVVFRRPVETRALGRSDLQAVVRSAVGREVAASLGRSAEFEAEWDDPEDWDGPG